MLVNSSLVKLDWAVNQYFVHIHVLSVSLVNDNNPSRRKEENEWLKKLFHVQSPQKYGTIGVEPKYLNLFQLGIKSRFLHGKSFHEAVRRRKIHVQIVRFMCCLNMTFTWKSLSWALICMHDVTRESFVAVTDHFAGAFVLKNVACVYMTLWRCNDVRKFDDEAILFREIKRKRRDN